MLDAVSNNQGWLHRNRHSWRLKHVGNGELTTIFRCLGHLDVGRLKETTLGDSLGEGFSKGDVADVLRKSSFRL